MAENSTEQVALRCAQFIEKFEDSYDATLDLSNLGLTTIPQHAIECLLNIEAEEGDVGLNLSGNPISDFSALHQLDEMNHLDVSHTSLSSTFDTLLAENGCLPARFDGLRARGLGLTRLPEQLDTKETEYTLLDLSDNQLTTIPTLTLYQAEFRFANNPAINFPEWIYDSGELKCLDIRDTGCQVDVARLLETNGVDRVFMDKAQVLNVDADDLAFDEKSRCWYAEVGLEYCDELDLSDEGLSNVPSFISKLEDLCYLDLSGNPLITELPEDIGNCSSLKYINFSNTSITSLPESMAELEEPRTLDVSHTQVAEVPEWLAELYLTEMNFSHTNISALPMDEFDVRPNLTHCKITELPDDFAESYPDTILDLTGNQLTCLPAELGDLMDLIVDGNQIEDLPESTAGWNLRKLSIKNNKLKSLPSDIGDHVVELYVNDNPFSGIHGDIKETGNISILDALGIKTPMSLSNEELYKALMEGEVGEQYCCLAPEKNIGEPGSSHSSGEFIASFDDDKWNPRSDVEQRPEGSLPLHKMCMSCNSAYYITKPSEGWAVYRTWGGYPWQRVARDLKTFLSYFEEWLEEYE